MDTAPGTSRSGGYLLALAVAWIDFPQRTQFIGAPPDGRARAALAGRADAAAVASARRR